MVKKTLALTFDVGSRSVKTQLKCTKSKNKITFRRLRFHVALQNFKVSPDCCNCELIVDNPPDVSLSLQIGRTGGTFSHANAQPSYFHYQCNN